MIKNKDTRPTVYTLVLKVTILENSTNEIKLIRCEYVSHISFLLVFFLSYHTVTGSDKNKESKILTHTLCLMQVQYTDYKHRKISSRIMKYD
jgi:hypothetical protein